MVNRRARSQLARLASWGYLVLLFVGCHTPAPLPRTPPDPVVPGDTSALEPPPVAKPAPRETPRETAPEPDYAAEQVALREQYAKHPSQGALRGEASYYGAQFAGRKTASGEVFEPRRYTAAHRTLPFGTVLRVTRVDTGAVVYVRVNDRGPYARKKRRILDLSQAAAAELDMLKRGIADVRAEVVEHGKTKKKKKKKSQRTSSAK
jgi:rare lipoprotein A